MGGAEGHRDPPGRAVPSPRAGAEQGSQFGNAEGASGRVKLCHMLPPRITESRERFQGCAGNGAFAGKAVSTNTLHSWGSKHCYFPLISKIIRKCHCCNIL